jgi:transketolase
VFTTPETPFTIGKALTLWDSASPRVAILSTGGVSYAALEAAKRLESKGIETVLVHIATVKPLDEEAILAVAKRVEHVITVEEHQVAGGFGSAVAELLSEQQPVSITRLGVHDQFGQSGEPQELLAHYGIDADAIEQAAEACLTKPV